MTDDGSFAPTGDSRQVEDDGAAHLDPNRDPIEELAAEFAELHRQGECPTVEQFAAKYPDFAGDIRDLFPTIVAMEHQVVHNREHHPLHQAVPVERLGDFRIVAEIGRGGMGVVYEAEQISLRRRVAVKVLASQCVPTKKDLGRFQREARTAARLHHSNIVPVFGFGEQDGVHYIVMQLIHGVGLDEILSELRHVVRGKRDEEKAGAASRGRRASHASRNAVSLLHEELRRSPAPNSSSDIEDSESSAVASRETDAIVGAITEPLGVDVDSSPSHGTAAPPDFSVRRPSELADDAVGVEYWRNVARIGVQVGSALNYAHLHRTLHRDIKPGNLLLDDEGVIWVADFGLAKGHERDNVSGTADIVGTLRYMAPERLEGEADSRSDIYSLGVTLYELLALEYAYQTDDRPALIQQITQGELSPLRKKNPDIPRDLETIVLRATAREPSERYQSAGELVHDLQCFLEDRPIASRRIFALERLWRWCRRNRAVAALAGTALSLLILVAVLATSRWVTESRLRQQAQNSAEVAERQRERAEATTQVAINVLEEIYNELAPNRMLTDSLSAVDDAAPNSAAQPAISKEAARLLEKLLVFYDQLAKQSEGSADVLLKSAIASRRVGDIHRQLGQLEEAQTAYHRAIELNRQLQALLPGDRRVQLELARNHNELGDVHGERFDRQRARQSHLLALQVLQAQPDMATADDPLRYESARTHYFLGIRPRRTLHRDKRSVDEEQIQKANALLMALLEGEPRNPEYRHLLSRSYLASNRKLEDHAEQHVVRILEELADEFPHVPDYRYQLGKVYERIDMARSEEPHGEEDADVFRRAESRLRKALAVTEGLERDHPVPRYLRFKSRVNAQLARIIAKAGGPLDEAQTHYETAIALQTSIIVQRPEEILYKMVLVSYQLGLAEVFVEQDELEAALELLESSVSDIEPFVANAAVDTDESTRSFGRQMLTRAYRLLSAVRSKSHQPEAAAEALRKAERLQLKSPAGP